MRLKEPMKPLYLEKKLTVLFCPEVNLLEQSDGFWQEFTAAAKVRILRQDSGKTVHSFLLAESSLLVWRDRLLLSTCGQGELRDLLPWIRKRFGENAVKAALFEAPEFSPDFSLRSCWEGDAESLAAWGKSDKSVLLDFVRRDFPDELRRLLPREAEVFQEHDFKPEGYSCNACVGDAFLTLHFSPEAHGSSCSFESRGFPTLHQELLSAAVHCFNPKTIFPAGS